MTSELAIELMDVSVSIEGTKLLSEIDLSVPTGTRAVVIGRNGAGKTTLFRVLAALQRPSNGIARILGQEFGKVDLRTLRKRIGLAGSTAIETLNLSMTALEAVLTGIDQVTSQFWLRSNANDIDRANRLLDATGLSKFANRQLSNLSMGERQQIGITRALISRPDILLLDEPSAGLDLGAREHLIERIESIVAMHPTMTIVLVTHHLEEIPPSFDFLIGLGAGGRLVASGALSSQLTSETASVIFDYPVKVQMVGQRYFAFGIG